MKFKCLPAFILLFVLGWIPAATAQETCPCEQCPAPILDEQVLHEFSLNIFNVQNNDLSDPNQCVSKVGITFTHDYLGDLVIKLISPAGQSITLVGPQTVGDGNDGTDLTTFDVSFVPASELAVPDSLFDARWENFQNWQLIGGTRSGSYYPYQGNLEDLDSGTVNGTWILQVLDQVPDKNDEGVLLDFYVEFCDSRGLVCDPCLDPEDDPCILSIDPGETTVVPDEEFCLPVYAKNVAFLKELAFTLNWDPTILNFSRVDSFNIEFLDIVDFNLSNSAFGSIDLDYFHDTDSLGLVLKDSTPIFQVCFLTTGSVGDSSLLTLPAPPKGIDAQVCLAPHRDETRGEREITL